MTASGPPGDERERSGAAGEPPPLIDPPAAPRRGGTQDRPPLGPSSQPSTQPMTAPGAIPERPLFDIDSWLEAPPGTMPGLADGALADAEEPVPDGDLARAFAADRFHDYDEILPGEATDRAEPVPAGISPFGMPPDDAPAAAPAAGPAQASGLTRAFVIVGGVLVAALALVAVFAAGRGMAGLATGSGAPSAPPSASASPSAPAGVPTALAAPGAQPWDRLGGKECLQGYTSPWAQSFTVVDCSRVHTAQLLLRAPFADGKSAAYPGAAALEQRMPALCSAPGVVDLSRAGAASDLQLTFAFPATRRQWEDGDRDYWCFASRSSGAPISGSITGGAQEIVWAARATPKVSIGPSPTPTAKKR